VRRLRVFRSGAFRLALLFALVFALGAVGLVATVKIAVTRYARATSETAILDESARLRGDARSGGIAAAIAARERMAGTRRFVYLLADPRGRMVAGSLPLRAATPGWANVETPDPTDADDEIKVRAFGARLPDGSLLIVGRDVSDLDDLSEWLDQVTRWSGLGIVVLALGGGTLIASVFVRRLDRVNMALQRIMAGKLDERVPAIGMGDEYDRLTYNLNAMLDRIQTLMEGLRQVSTDIAHDLRTPLTRLRQQLESTLALDPSEAVESAVDRALAQVDEVLMTFDALLRIGQIEAGAGRARFETLDLSAIMERVRLAFEPAANDAGKSLVAGIAAGIAVRGDRELLTQMFANLIENALTHTYGPTTIVVSLARDGNAIIAAVADDGPGIPAHERDRVIRRFYRLDASRSTAGSGLGLALVAAIAELHGARLTLAANDPGLRVEVRFAETPLAVGCFGAIPG